MNIPYGVTSAAEVAAGLSRGQAQAQQEKKTPRFVEAAVSVEGAVAGIAQLCRRITGITNEHFGCEPKPARPSPSLEDVGKDPATPAAHVRIMASVETIQHLTQ